MRFRDDGLPPGQRGGSYGHGRPVVLELDVGEALGIGAVFLWLHILLERAELAEPFNGSAPPVEFITRVHEAFAQWSERVELGRLARPEDS